jgi:uncharacterized integral membrane protein
VKTKRYKNKKMDLSILVAILVPVIVAIILLIMAVKGQKE